MAKLEISLLRKAYGDAAILRDVSFTVAAGALVAILGASGSGKTTLLRLIAGFETPDAGTIAIGGEVMAAAGIFRRPEARGIGYVAQDGALFPHLSVADNITFGLPRAARRAQSRVPELLRLVGLPEHYASRPPQQLSGGEQQRIALARALAPEPKLVLLDEPFSALDAGLRAETRAAVATALAAAGATAILVTHDQEEALSMGALAGVLQNGVLSALVPPEILYRHPATPSLAHFIGDAVMMRGIAAGADVDCALGLLRIPAGVPSGPVDVMVRPEQIKLNLGYIPGSVPAVIRNIRFFGHDAVVELAVSQAGEQVTARVFSHAVPKAGSDVWLHVEGEVVAYAADRVGA